MKADWCICNPFQIINLREINKNIILCWKDFTNYIYWIKKKYTNYIYNGLQGIGLRPDRFICKPFPNREFERENKNHLSLLERFYKLFYWSKKKESVNIYWIKWYPIIGIVVLIICFCFLVI